MTATAHKKPAHLALQPPQLAPLRDRNPEVLDARVVHENDLMAFMPFEDEHHRLAVAPLPGLTDRSPTTVGLSHSAYTFDGLHEPLSRCEPTAALPAVLCAVLAVAADGLGVAQ